MCKAVESSLQCTGLLLIYVTSGFCCIERSSPGDEDLFEGTLVRKHEWENTTIKATQRSWDKVFVVLRGSQLAFYKDGKVAKTTPDQTFKGEGPLSLHKAEVSIASDYKKKKHVFRLK